MFCLLPLAHLEAQLQNNADIDYISPVPGSSLNMPQATIAIRTKEEIDPASLASSGIISVTGASSGNHTGRVVLSDDARTILFVPNVPFTEGEDVTVSLGNGLHVMDGSSVSPLKFNFTITPKLLKIPPPQINLEGSIPFSPHASSMSSVFAAKDSTLPASFPKLNITTDSITAPGYLFLANFVWISGPVSTPYLMILDNSGTPYFYRQLSTTAIDFDMQPNGHLTYFDEEGWMFYEMDSSYTIVNSYQCGNGYVTDDHELRLLPNGHALLIGDDEEIVDMSKIVPNGNPNAVVSGIIIQELDQAKNVVFQWRSWDHFQITDATHEDLTAAAIDYVHSNALELDGDGNILLSSRHLDEITKIDRSTGNTIWRMGGKNNQFTFVNDSIGYSHQHAVRRLANGNLTLFDNGNFHTPPFSRAVEYQVDEVNKIATLVWQYRNNPDYVSVAMGYVQRLANGNTLIGWGATNPSVTEVTSDGKKVYEMSLPDQVVSYRAFRYQWNVRGTTTGTGVKTANAAAPDVMTLNGNYPNPFNPTTKISFVLPATGAASLKVYNILGQEVATLVDGIVRGEEVQTVSFDGSALASGVYYYRLQSGQKIETRKMVLIK
jgi:hypothetical protein